MLWLRGTLRNPGAEPQRGVLVSSDRFTDRVEAWTQDGGAWSAIRSGEAVPASEKILRGRAIAFPVTVPAHGERVAYLRADDFSSRMCGWRGGRKSGRIF